DGSPALGQTWGAGSGSYKLRKGKLGFRATGSDPNDGSPIAGTVPIIRPSGDTGTSSPLTVASVNPGTGDSTVSVSNVNLLDVNLIGGLRVSGTSGTATILLQATSATHAGGVSLSDQYLGRGVKSLDQLRLPQYQNVPTLSDNDGMV